MLDKSLLKQLDEQKKLLKKQKNSPILQKNLNDQLRIELTYNSNAIEGNTLSRQETTIVLTEGLSIPGKKINELLEARNHDEALSYVIELSKKIKIHQISQQHILEIHRKILAHIDDSNAGTYRRIPVRILGSQTILPNYLKVPDLMDELILFSRTSKEHPFFIASELHYRLVGIHPFVDGNGRTARLLFNLVLLIAGFPLTYIAQEDRTVYLWALEKAQTGGGGDQYDMLMRESVQRSFALYTGTQETKNKKAANSLLKISQLANKIGVPVSTIRYRTQIGILSIEKHTPGGYALYSMAMAEKAKLMLRLQKSQKLSLEELKKLLK